PRKGLAPCEGRGVYEWTQTKLYCQRRPHELHRSLVDRTEAIEADYMVPKSLCGDSRERHAKSCITHAHPRRPLRRPMRPPAMLVRWPWDRWSTQRCVIRQFSKTGCQVG